MSFAKLPDLGPLLLPDAAAYAERCTALSRAALERVRHVLDIPYGPDRFQQLDIYLPGAAPAAGAPVMVFFHGGAWRHGHKEWQGFMAPPLVDLPSVFVSANYRLAPAARLDDQLADCIAALDWTVRNIARFGGNPTRLFLGGHSAGGHLAALVALSRLALIGADIDPEVVRGCCPISGLFDLRRGAGGVDPFLAPLLPLVLPDGSDGSEFSPLVLARAAATPFLVTYGERDMPAARAQGEAFAAALRRGPAGAETYVVAGASHFEANLACADPDDRWVTTVRRWMAAPVAAPAAP